MTKRTFNHLTFTDRLRIEEGKRHGLTAKQIADELGVHFSTIYRELKRGTYQHKTTVYDDYGDKEYRYKLRYSPDIADEKYRQNLQAKGAPLKIGNDFSLANYIEKRIADDGLTPLSVIGEIKRKKLSFETSICVRTLYSYIEKGVFLRLDLKHLPLKGHQKKHERKLKPAKAPRGESIEKRPAVINDRTEFGHWEMDCVVGKTLETLLVLTERLTRKEIIIKIPNKKTESVVKAINTLERRYGKRFKQVFKSITVDNGVEFSDCYGMEKSSYAKKNKRTKFYYCHPYTSCERGTNERMNREIRRKFPKGTSFKQISEDKVKSVEEWINNYPRPVLDFATSDELFTACLNSLP